MVEGVLESPEPEEEPLPLPSGLGSGLGSGFCSGLGSGFCSGLVSSFQSQVTAQVALAPSYSTVMVALPGATALILPLSSMVATLGLLEVKVAMPSVSGSAV